jgi:hypothetical protein
MKKNKKMPLFSYPKHGILLFIIAFNCKICDQCFVENEYLSSFATQFVSIYSRAINIYNESYIFSILFSCVKDT